MNFVGIKFRGPVLSQLLVYLISQFFQKITKFNLFEYVCVFVFICVCAYKCDIIQNNVVIAKCAAQYRVLIFNM